MKASDIIPGECYIAHRSGTNAGVTADVLAGRGRTPAALVHVVARGPYLEKAAGPCGQTAVVEAPGVDLAYRVQMLNGDEWIDRVIPLRAFILGWASWLELHEALVTVADDRQAEWAAYEQREKALQGALDEVAPTRLGWRYDYSEGRGSLRKDRRTVEVVVDDLHNLLFATPKVRRAYLRAAAELVDLRPPTCERPRAVVD